MALYKSNLDRTARHVIGTRVFTVLAAMLLVGAFTLGTVLGPDLPLSAALAMLDTGLVSGMQALANQYLPGWVWEHVALPLLTRPAWLLPASLGLIMGGGAVTLASAAGASRSRRRRS
jgi:hypothetical protein